MSLKHLAILVPYRDRQAHLSAFLPHMQAYLGQMEAAGHFTWSIHIIEQLGQQKFNRGKLLNCGFALSQNQADYICLHDVDYLPLDADYRPVDRPTRLIWHGLTLNEDYETFFSAVVAFPNETFARINGYSNDYWGWGYEDIELRFRCQINGIVVTQRDGVYKSLPHPHNGVINGELNEVAKQNRARCKEKLLKLKTNHRHDGLSNLSFDLSAQHTLDTAGRATLHQVWI